MGEHEHQGGGQGGGHGGGHHQHGDSGIDIISASQLELMSTAPGEFNAAAERDRQSQAAARPKNGHATVHDFRKRERTLEGMAKAQHPDSHAVGVDVPSGAVGALAGGLGGALLFGGPVGLMAAGLGAAFMGVEVQRHDNYKTLAEMPGAALHWLDEQSGISPLSKTGYIPFSKAPDAILELLKSMDAELFPEMHAFVSMLAKVWMDDFEPTFTKMEKVGGALGHWEEVQMSRAEIFGENMEHAAAKTINRLKDDETRAEFHKALEHVAAVFGGKPGEDTGLVGKESKLDPKMQKIELATIGHLVGERLAECKVDSDGTIHGFKIKQADKSIVEVDLNITNARDLEVLAHSVFDPKTKYGRMPAPGSAGQSAEDSRTPGPPEPTPEDAAQKHGEMLRKSAQVGALFAASGLREEQFLSMMGLNPEDKTTGTGYHLEKNTGDWNSDENKGHLQVVYRDEQGREHRKMLYEEGAEPLERTRQQLAAVVGISNLDAQGQHFSQEELMRGMDFSKVEGLDQNNPGITIDPQTLEFHGNFADGERHKFDLNNDGVAAMQEKVLARENLTLLEAELSSPNDRRNAAMLEAVRHEVETRHAGLVVSLEHGKLVAHSATDLTEIRLDQILGHDALVAASAKAEEAGRWLNAVDQVKAGSSGGSGGGGGGSGGGTTGSGGGQGAPSVVASGIPADVLHQATADMPADIHHSPEAGTHHGASVAPSKTPEPDAPHPSLEPAPPATPGKPGSGRQR